MIWHNKQYRIRIRDKHRNRALIVRTIAIILLATTVLSLTSCRKVTFDPEEEKRIIYILEHLTAEQRERAIIIDNLEEIEGTTVEEL
jgi:hypothetical protein